MQALEFLGIAGLPIREETVVAASGHVFSNVKTLVIGNSHFSEVPSR